MGDIGEIVRGEGEQYLQTHRVTPQQRKALAFMARCRTESMGLLGKVACEECGTEYPIFRSCRNRNCPGCQAGARAAWLDAREQELLDVPYFHVVFTVPEELNVIALWCPEVFYAALQRTAGKALLDVGFTKLQARLAVLAILHTWGQNLWLHPHAHCVVPGGGFSADGKRWISVPNPEYLLPVKVLMRHFRTLLCRRLRAAARRGQLRRLPAEVSAEQVIAAAAAKAWVVYAKAPFGGPEQVLEYLSQYTHRVAISNSRILAYENGAVTFRWRDYADSNQVKECTVTAEEFLRRFLLHVLPARFVRIRYFGFFANGDRTENIRQARALIGQLEVLRFHRKKVKPQRLCPVCRAFATSRNDQSIVPVSALRSPPHINAA
jgi:Putative transposase/Transposase zinc-binding domain